MKTSKINNSKNWQLSPEEQEEYDAIERGEWKSVGNIDKIRKEMAEVARYTRSLAKKDRRVSLRVNNKDLDMIRSKAAQNRLPYQTLISTVLHHFATGRVKIEL